MKSGQDRSGRQNGFLNPGETKFFVARRFARGVAMPILATALGIATVARADIAPTPPYLSAPPTFLFILVAVYALLLTSVGLGSLVNKVLKKSGGGASKKRLLGIAVLIAFAITVCFEVVSDISYRRNRADRRARSAARSDLGAIRSTEVAYFAEWNVWVGNQPPTPVADRRGNGDRVPWNQNTRFSILGFAPEGSVICSYSLEGPDWPTEGFTARAECDYDRDGQLAIYTITNANSEIIKSGAPF